MTGRSPSQLGLLWLVGGLVGLLGTFAHVTGWTSLDGLNPLYLSGCATAASGERRYAQTMPLPEEVESGITLAKQGVSGHVGRARFARGQMLIIDQREEPLFLVGVNSEARVLHLLDSRRQVVEVPFDDINRIRPTDGRGALHWAREGSLIGAVGAGLPGLATLIAVGPCLMAFGNEDEVRDIFVLGTVTPAAAGLGLGAMGGALYGASQSPPSGYGIGPQKWQIQGGRSSNAAPSGEATSPPVAPRAEEVAPTPMAIEPPPRAPDDEICADSRSFGLGAPPGCRCGGDDECASALCGGVEPERRCTSRCPLGCPQGMVCLVPLHGGTARCGPSP